MLLEERLIQILLKHYLSLTLKTSGEKWRGSFEHTQSNVNIVSGISCSYDICEGCFQSFKNNFRNSGDVVELKSRYITIYEQYMTKTNCDLMLSVGDIEAVFKILKVNKAVGSDGLIVEHLKFAGGRLPFLLTKLFNGCPKHGFLQTHSRHQYLYLCLKIIKTNVINLRDIKLSPLQQFFQRCIYAILYPRLFNYVSCKKSRLPKVICSRNAKFSK